MDTKVSKATIFRHLHHSRPGFITPNAWDAGSAVILANEGFKAIATTSGGIAFSLGKPDYYVGDPSVGVTRDEMLDRARTIVEVVDIPVSGDLEAGYGDSPESVAETIRMAIEAGLAGGNIEDRMPHGQGLYEEGLAVERIRAARAAIDAMGSDFVLTARTDAFMTAGVDPMKEVIRRCNLFRQAGADCLYAPGPSDTGTIKLILREIDGPLNVVMGLGNTNGNVHALLEAGVQRISLGASIARSVFALIRGAAREVIDRGTIGYAANQMPQADLNGVFANHRTNRASLSSRGSRT
jgi:2-methylisocitrate lyase-like PEP mutase family enzyme